MVSRKEIILGKTQSNKPDTEHLPNLNRKRKIQFRLSDIEVDKLLYTNGRKKIIKKGKNFNVTSIKSKRG